MTQIEIDLSKIERGTHEGRVKVTRGGKTFWRKQRVGVKETQTTLPLTPEMTDSEIGTAFCSGKKIPLTVNNVSRDKRVVTITFKEPGWRVEIEPLKIKKVVKSGRIITSTKTLYETNVAIYKNNKKVNNYNTQSIELKDDDASSIRIDKASEKIVDKIKNSIGVSLVYDSSHRYKTEEEVEKLKTTQKEQETREDKKEKIKPQINIGGVMQHIKDVQERGVDVFVNKPEEIFGLLNNIIDVKRDIFPTPIDPKTTSILYNLVNIITMSKEKALEYISNVDNHENINRILSVYQNAYEMKM